MLNLQRIEETRHIPVDPAINQQMTGDFILSESNPFVMDAFAREYTYDP